MKKIAGFTLVEAVIGMLILSILSAGILLFMKPVTDLWVNNNFNQGIEMEGRQCVLKMVRDMDQLKNRSSVITANATTYSFVDTTNNTITYLLESGVLKRRQGTGLATARAIAAGVSGLAFTYYDKDNQTIATPVVGSTSFTNIRRIGIVFTVSAGGRSAQIRSHSHPRNTLE